MGRVIKTIEIEGKSAVALFDTGAVHAYVLRKYVYGAPKLRVAKPYEVGLGGRSILVRTEALVNGKIEGLDFNTTVVPIDSLGRADGHTLVAIIGALTMKRWEISVHPKDGSLGQEGLRRREFTEY